MIHEDCLTCYTFPNECSRPSHQCPDRQLRAASAKAVAEDDYTFSIAKSAFVHFIADAYKAGKAAGATDLLAALEYVNRKSAIDMDDTTIEVVTAAIAKARG